MAVFLSCIACMGGAIASVLSVLKLAGIIVGIIILVLIIIAACLLFIPIRYEGRGNIETKVYDVKIHWFLRIVQFCFHSSDGSIDYYIRLFGKRTRFLDKDFLEARKEKRAKKKKKKAEKNAGKKERERQKHKKKRDKKKKNIQLDTEQASDVKKSSESISKSTDFMVKSDHDAAASTECDSGHLKNADDSAGSQETEEAPSKLKKIWHTLTKALKLMNEYHPVALVWPGLQKLLYHIRPRLLKTDLIFGFTDPSVTGKILGAISNLYFIYQYEEFHLSGDFETEKTYIEGSFLVKGHIRGIYLLIFFIGLIRQKDFRRFLKALKKSKNGGVS